MLTPVVMVEFWLDRRRNENGNKQLVKRKEKEDKIVNVNLSVLPI